MPSKFNNFPSPEQVYTGSDTDIQREKRMNNWVRSNSLPSMIGDAVQSAMLNNPYDRSAALRAELAQHTANSMNLPWRTKEALATELFKQSPIDATSGDGAAPGTRIPHNPVAATQSAGPVATFGNINGQDVVVPTAGNYMNGGYQSLLQKYSLGETPTVDAFNSAVSNYQSPEQKFQAQQADQQYRRAVDVANINAQGRVNAASMKGAGKGQDAPLKAQQKLYGGDDKQRQAYTKELYGEYKKFVKENGADVPFEAWTLSDPIARAITSKYQDLGQQSGRSGRESRQAKADLMTGNMTPGAQAEKLAQRTIDGSMIHPEVQSKISQGIAQARAAGASDEQILAIAQQSGLSDGELAAVQQELGGKILKAQYGNPGVHPAKKKSMKGSAFNAEYQKTLTRGASLQPPVAPYAPLGRDVTPWMNESRAPQYSMDDPTNDVGSLSNGPAPSLLDQLIQRIQSMQVPSLPSPSYPFMPLRPSSPIA